MSSTPSMHEHTNSTAPGTSPSSPSPSNLPSSPTYSLSPTPSIHPHHDSLDTPSDLPLLRRTHLKTGYRAGITAGKSDPETAQNGFDVGYPIGAGVGMRVGRVLGGLGYLNSSVIVVRGDGGDGDGVDEVEGGVSAREMVQMAEKELSLEALMGEMGLADVGAGDGYEAGDLETSDEKKMEAQLNVERIGESPTLLKWEGILSDLGKRYGVDFGV